MTEIRQPAEVFPPGEFLEDELNARGWTQTEFAEIIGRPPRVVNEIIAGKRAITPETAKEFAAALGTSPHFWMNLETYYQLSKTSTITENISRVAMLRERFPVRDMIKRGWIESSTSPEVVETQVLNFYNIKSVDDKVQLPHAAKKNKDTYKDTYNDISPVQWAWLYRVKQIADTISVPKYSEEALRKAISKLRALLIEPDEARHVPRILMECGIRFIVVESLPTAKIDGVCLWLDKNQPVIAMSLSRDQIDNFWFVLRHEIEHVLNKDGQEEGAVIDADLTGENAGNSNQLAEEERLANIAAADFCVSSEKLSSFLARKKPFYYEKDVLSFAALQGVHPGLVIGQMQHNLKDYAYLKKRLTLSKIRQFVLSGAIYDGWGHIAPV